MTITVKYYNFIKLQIFLQFYELNVKVQHISNDERFLSKI